MIEELDYIENEIIQPLNQVLNSEPVEIDGWYWSRIKYFFNVCYDNQHQSFLYKGIHPIYELYIYRRHDLFDQPYSSLREFIQYAIDKDLKFGLWAK